VHGAAFGNARGNEFDGLRFGLKHSRDAIAATFANDHYIGIAVIGLRRRRLLSCAWVLLLMPLYWLMLSLAAWRAVIQLIRDPYRWEKTEHGLARTSRLSSASNNEQ
jgi:hypothetical protein